MDKVITRKQMRLKDYNYSDNGCYFVTICARNRENIFGEICDKKMVLNEYGKIINSYIHDLPCHIHGIIIDEYIVMPNHVHIIIGIQNVGTDLRVGPMESGNGQAQRPVPTNPSLSNIIRRLKTITTTRYIDGVNNQGWPPYENHIWQRSFYDRIIRNDNELNRIRAYICDNPINWEHDENNSAL